MHLVPRGIQVRLASQAIQGLGVLQVILVPLAAQVLLGNLVFQVQLDYQVLRVLLDPLVQ